MKSAGIRIHYLNLDYGINVCGVKGASVHLRSICTALARIGRSVSVICTRCDGDMKPFPRLKIPVQPVPLPAEFNRFRKELNKTYETKIQLPYEIRQCAYNQSALTYLENEWRVNRPDLIVERLSLMGIAGVRVANDLGIPHFTEVNSLLSDEARAFRGLLDQKTAREIEDTVLRRTNRIFVVSSELRDAIVERGIDAEKIITLPNAYDDDVFKPAPIGAAKKNLKLSGRFVVGMAGSMKSWHGVKTLLHGFGLFAKRCPQSALLLIGEGPESERIEAFQNRHPHLKIIATGGVHHADVARLLQGCDVCVAPYDRLEKFYFSPMKVYEYMALGKAVVATDQGQIREIIKHGENGLLFEPGHHRQLRDRLARLQTDAPLRRRLGREARDSVADQTWTANAEKIVQQYFESML